VKSHRSSGFAVLAIAATLGWTAGAEQAPPPGMQAPAAASETRWAQYEARGPKTILELQPFRQLATQAFETAAGLHGTATLIDLNPRINAWYLLRVRWETPGEEISYHLENPQPASQVLVLSELVPLGIRISTDRGDQDCVLWADPGSSVLERARQSGLPYAPLCGDRLYLRNPVAGTYTHLERITDFLRDHVWGGEKLIGFIREQFFHDAFLERDGQSSGSQLSATPAAANTGPGPALIEPSLAGGVLVAEHLGIDVRQGSRGLAIGQWYPVRDAPGIFVSAIKPNAIAASILGGQRAVVAELDPVERDASDYLVGLDLSRFELRFAVGTDHPRVGWSERVLPAVRDDTLPGPDGIGSVAPVVVNGMVSPALVARTAAAFAGGFKRAHGAFRFGPLAQRNAGTHYGFIEQGVIFSKLQRGLATLFVTDEGVVQLQSWAPEDDALLGRVMFARQNGMPLVEYDASRNASRPGATVNLWGPGNWSGSSESKLRTLRSGICMQESPAGRFLVYGYFSTATPSAMTRVFQAYGCRYAMQLDINALEHTYFALYVRTNGRIAVQHLIDGMAEVDRKGGEQLAPRFLGFPDDRDFFYLTRRAGSP
jgi:hypothetical protein